ncbi:hypothetical protein AB1I77_27870 [Bacillus paranthracis]
MRTEEINLKQIIEMNMLYGVPPHAHQLKNENKMNFRSNKLKNT